jgi:hypothetical protein
MDSITKEVARQNTLAFSLLGVPSVFFLTFGLTLLGSGEVDPALVWLIPNPLLLGWISLGLAVILLGGFYARTIQIPQWEAAQRGTPTR